MVDPVLAGLAGGFAGTVVMSIPQMAVMGDDPSPTQVMMSKVNGRPPEENQASGMVAHLFYGTVMGLVLAVLTEAFLDPVASYEVLTFTLIGLGWGMLLWLGSFFWMGVLGLGREMMLQPMVERVKQGSMMFVLHLVYGGVTGATTVLLV